MCAVLTLNDGHCTADGNSYAVDGAAGGLKAVPATHREEVAEKLRAIQALAAKALGV
jgi:hypothetical protein